MGDDHFTRTHSPQQVQHPSTMMMKTFILALALAVTVTTSHAVKCTLDPEMNGRQIRPSYEQDAFQNFLKFINYQNTSFEKILEICESGLFPCKGIIYNPSYKGKMCCGALASEIALTMTNTIHMSEVAPQMEHDDQVYHCQ